MEDQPPACRLEYLRGVDRGQTTAAKLEVSPDLLQGGYRLWVRPGRSQPFRRVRDRISVHEFSWENDLHPIDLRCFVPESGEYLSASALLKREPLPGWRIENKLFVSSADNAVVYLPDFNLGHESPQGENFWITQEIEEWRAVELPSARWPLCRDRPYGLLTFEAAEGRPEMHVVVAVTPELTVGRLHLGDQRYLNQSSKGSHWHLGWQRERVDPNFTGGRNEVPEGLLVKSRDWMKRCAGVLELDPHGEEITIQARSLDDAGRLDVRPVGQRQWDLTLGWTDYADSLRIHAEEAALAGSLVPWFWASRCGVEPGLEDRYYLWLPWHWELLDLAVGQGGWIDSLVRWQVEREYLVFVDEGSFT